ncbi:MAG: hypothetical protein HZR80_14270 [Candidatus Heimdallarchaeota archaeon]
MSPEAEEAPTDHMKVSRAVKKGILEVFVERNAYDEETAISEDDLDLFGQKRFALDDLIKDAKIIEILSGSKKFYHINEAFKPVKDYRKAVVRGLSIPMLIFFLALLLAGFIMIVWQIVIRLT